MRELTTSHARNEDRLRVHRAVMATTGPEALASIARDLTPHELELIEGFKARIAGLNDAQLLKRFGISPALRQILAEALA